MKFLSYFMPKAPWTFVYMLQQVEYDPSKFVRWVASLPNLQRVQNRGKLHTTGRVMFMLCVSYALYLVVLAGGLFLAVSQTKIMLLLCLLAPITSIIGIFISTLLLQRMVIDPKQNREIAAARQKLQSMSATRIAVIGSYGKTTMKELLVTVLSEAKKVVATPGNKNVVVSHARWVNQKLTGDEDVLIFEYGEGKPGDISDLTTLSNPQLAVITGLAPAHLDAYASVEAIADDFATIQKTLPAEDIWLNSGSDLLRQKIQGRQYDETGIDDWKVRNIEVGFSGTSFTLQSGERVLKIETGLLGAHQVGPLCVVVAVAERLGLSDQQIISGIAKTTAYEHRMQARSLHGAWIIDDTYNGNIEGMRAGLDLLQALPGQKKIYVTPGLVDQGSETIAVHTRLGSLIAAAKPDKVVLMKNSVSDYIQTSLAASEYSGEVVIETDPLEFYTNIEHYLAAGDVVLMQNDWPDSYV